MIPCRIIKAVKQKIIIIHNGIVNIIKDWTKLDQLTNEEGHKIRFIDKPQGKDSI